MSKDHDFIVEDLKEDEHWKEPKINSDSYNSPTREEQKIPSIKSCPPAPKKPKRALVLGKRKLGTEKEDHLQFFEYTRREEVESFLNSSFSEISRVSSIVGGGKTTSSSAKRRIITTSYMDSTS
ncbi:hypothetical protein M9H77_16314 [Catharanthus roseus]|uniref:Uncharacterized protein n=1 Tax=Catharanthus roseus TaxID=4058 RepID=A0ACC0B1F5_CATRO|nr:hypothetical protein M9H77_16314 [Catharanthus roseus]